MIAVKIRIAYKIVVASVCCTRATQRPEGTTAPGLRSEVN